MLHYNYRPGYMYYDCVCGKRFTYTGNRIVFGFCCMGSIVYGCQLEEIMEVRNLIMFENLLQKAMELNEMPGVDVYFCINGETQVVALSVMQNKTLVYQNRFFFPRLDNKVKEVTEHLEKMLEVAGCGKNITPTV